MRSIAFLLAFASPALAATGEIKGRVADRSGTPLPGVTIIISNPSLGVSEQGGVTNANGEFRIIALPAGPGYRLRATLPTYAPLEFSDLEVAAGEARTQNIVLQPASELKETVKVQAKPDVVNTESVTTSTTFNSEFISGLPVLGRDYQDILSLAPGVTDVNNTGNPNIHGARDTDVLTLVDGMNTTDPFSGYYGQQLNIESIQEIEVITSGSRAEFSRAQGGFVNILTKSGGNEFQGTFKFFMRSSLLDGDGAGMDDPELEGGVGTEQGFRDVHFTDLYPYLSASGAFIKDRLWYFFSGEYVQVEMPVNSLTQTFVAATHGYRAFGKATWQMNPANKLAFSVTLDRTVDENQGLSSVVAPESGYFFKRGGPTYALRETAVFSPSIYLESSLGWFDNNFQRSPTLNPDTNHNGILTVDDRPDLGGNGDGIIQVSEADPGEDFDRDGFYDIFEDKDRNGKLDIGEDLDGDGRLTLPVACEGSQREDMNCNGLLDSEEDKNLDGLIQPNEDTGIPCFDFVLCPQGTLPGTAGNGRFDTEDRNGDGSLDVLDDSGFTPYPFWQDANHNDKVELGEFRSPTPADQPFARDTSGRYSGPNPYEYDDHRTRFTLREDLSIFAGDFGGSHDLKVGAIYEDEGYDGTTTQRPNLRTPRARTASSVVRTTSTTPSSYVAYLGVPVEVEKSATGENYGLFIQDTYKPIPNLTLGLGLRVDQENLSSAGYTFFDPAVQRQQYNALIEMSGVDLTPNGITAAGLCQDPIYNCGATGSALPLDLADLYHDLRVLAPQRFTHHNSEVDILGPFLSGLLPPNADINDLRFNIRTPEPIEIRNTNVAPRLSLTWDPWADGKSKAFASWGRFYDKLFLNSVTLEQGPDTVSRFYAFDKDGLDNEGRPDNQFGGVLSQAAPSGFQVDRNLSTPYTDELTLGFQREIAPEVSLGITYIRRDFQNQLQDIDVNHYTVVDPATGRLADTLGEELVAATFGRVGGQRQPDGIPDLYIRDFFFNRIFRMGNYNQQTYRGVELELVKRLSRKWQMEASYTFSRSKGDAESFLSENGDDPALTEFEPGFLDYDQTHVVKFNATAFLPGDWRLGGNIVYASGLPYSFIQETDSSDDVGYFQGRRLFGYYDYRGFIPENRNIHRNHATYRINVRTEKSFVIGKASSSAFFEVYNLLNTDDLRIYTYDTGVTRLNAVGERDFGRRFQFGIQVNF